MRCCLVVLLLCFGIPSFSAAQNKEVDSLKKIIASKAADTIKLQAYTNLNWIFSQTEFELSKKYALQELALAKKTGSKKWIAQAWNDIGISDYKLNLLDSALHAYNQSLQIRRALKDTDGIASSLSKLGIIQLEMGELATALNSELEALKIFELRGKEQYIAMTFNNISQIFARMKNYDMEIEYGEKAIALHLKNGDEYNAGLCYCNLALTYKLKNNIKRSQEYFKKALAVFKKYDDPMNESVALNAIGFNYKLEGDVKKALDYYKQAYELASSIDERAGMALYAHNISVSLTDLGAYTQAEKYSLKVLQSTEAKNRTQLALTYRQLTAIYGYLNNGAKATYYLNKYADLKDSIYTQESATQVAEMDVKYRSEKKDLELVKNKAELDAKDHRDFIKNLIILCIMVISILLGLLFFSTRKRRQIKQKAEADSEQAKQKELRSKAVIEAEEKERRRIAQDLHDGIGQILSAAKLNLSGLEDKLKPISAEQSVLLSNALDLVNDSVKEVRAVSHNMMPNTLIKLGLASAVREFITKIGSVPNLKIDLQIVGMDERLDNTIETVLYRVIQEVVSNIIKHARANHISMQLIKHDNELTVMIEDNGVGFDKNRISEFEGIGLKNIISRIEFLNGHVDFDSTPGQGTTVVIEVPLV